MCILRICEKCGFPISDDLRVAREQAICCCVKSRSGIAVIINEKPKIDMRRRLNDISRSVHPGALQYR